MPSRLRVVLRSIRMLVACLVLGLVASPAALARVDTIEWTAAPRSAASVEAPGRSARPATRVAFVGGDDARPLQSDPHAARRQVVSRPARARDLVVRHRIYLHHAALLC